MRRITYIIGLFAALLFVGCEPDTRTPIEFEDAEDLSIFDYLMNNNEEFSSFIAIVEKGGLAHALSAYNPYGEGFTLFLPDNDAVNRFIENDQRFSSLEDILEAQEFVNVLSRYHVINMEVLSNQFPFGAFSELTLSEDYLTVSFIIETDSSFYKINNSAVVIKPNIETSNGYIHQIQEVLAPITFTSREWFEEHNQFTIFNAAVDITGLESLIDFNYKDFKNKLPVTVLAEPDSIFQREGIYSLNDLIARISPDDDNYKDASNLLNSFVSYHILSGGFFIDDFVDENSVYTTFSEVPLNINGLGLDVKINKGKQVFDTIINNSDTTFIDYILFKYDESNVITQSGAIHFIDRVMEVKRASRAIYTFQFFEEPLINEYRLKAGTYLIEQKDSLQKVTWTGPDLYFVDTGDEASPAWNNNYLEINGDFSISYKLPRVIQGIYLVKLGAEAFNPENALIEVYIDSKKIGNLVDLTSGGSSTNPFRQIELGKINFTRYSEHLVEIKPLIPGRFLWDYIRFEPVN